ncbi:MAG: hypothetical protein ACI4MJ_03115, partial [Aristaeellaceae bacterium]
SFQADDAVRPRRKRQVPKSRTGTPTSAVIPPLACFIMQHVRRKAFPFEKGGRARRGQMRSFLVQSMEPAVSNADELRRLLGNSDFFFSFL